MNLGRGGAPDPLTDNGSLVGYVLATRRDTLLCARRARMVPRARAGLNEGRHHIPLDARLHSVSAAAAAASGLGAGSMPGMVKVSMPAVTHLIHFIPTTAQTSP